MSNKAKCAVCKAPATVFVGYISGEKLIQACYCHDHAKDMGVLQAAAYGLLDSGDVERGPISEKDGLVCPDCGYTRRLWKHTGRLGCPTCYETFHDDVAALLPRMHRGTEHMGRVPKKQLTSKLVSNRIRALQQELERAIKDERYEDAAQARDEMSGLRAQVRDGTGQ